MTVRWYRKKPVAVQALRWEGDNWDQMLRFVIAQGGAAHTEQDALIIRTLEGDMVAAPGDWVIRGVEGEFYPVKASIFLTTYEPTQPEGATHHEHDR